MNKIKLWASKHIDVVKSYIETKKYTELLKIFEKESGLSQVRMAAIFHCDRRSIRRYLSGERTVPMAIVNLMLNSMGINYAMLSVSTQIVSNHADENDQEPYQWNGDTDTLLNTLLLHRKKCWKLSRFEVACKLNIDENMLSAYEHGERKIPPTVVDKILAVFNIPITDLFPTLVTYDGSNTYLPLDVKWRFSFDNMEYELGKMYNCPITVYIPLWPISRYDQHTKVLLNYMPNELNMDEYYNTDELRFLKDITEDKCIYYEFPDFSGKKLPPCYQHIEDFYNGKHFPGKREIPLNQKIVRWELTTDYKFAMTSYSKPNIFDLSDYVFSDSHWYQKLQDIRYFKTGKLVIDPLNSGRPTDMSLIWPDGQYIRIAELYIDKYYHKRGYMRAQAMTGRNWLIYEKV